ncbi:molybdopterin-guanine dinucleotide biosynthesis protein B [Staphylococcus felis]|uniref:molybdopterin-guanine dinucleotide biosynthesis protein B n=1 Tax=Staphylococcus felis TaxID=46127 RepID=UPI000E227863|nr:molybdopterin-guanine dinucleotide biosynthesis protein B [Staphylococcus felis]REH79381.1 molybdopterin-guanine dinucleotide biosynthesis protein B [Staphylococcus felis]
MILQIVGYKNSGKTTVMIRAVQLLKDLGYHVTTIKHHGHMGEDIQLPDSKLDHMKHFNAGADQSIVQGHEYVETIKRDNESALETLIADYVRMDNNIILVEGYKNAPYEKVILYRNIEDYNQLIQLQNVVYTIDQTIQNNDISSFEKWLKTWVNKQKG